MHTKEIDLIVEQSSRKLLQISIPPVRYWLLTQVLEKSRKDALLSKTALECTNFSPKTKLLGKMKPDGTWPIAKNRKLAEEAGPGPPIGWTYRTMLWNLFTLAEYNASREEGYIDESLRLLLKWQNQEGYIPGPWTDVFPLPYFNGYALHLLHRFGLWRENGVRRLSQWLLSIQRFDGGWNIPYVMDMHYLPEYKGMRMRDFVELLRRTDRSTIDLGKFTQFPSSPYATMVVLWGLMLDQRLADSDAVKRGADFVLDRFFKKNPHSSYYMTEDHWTKLRYPYRFGSGLHALDILTKIGYGADDPRMDRPIKWLLESRSADGLWTQYNRPHAEKDQWITLIALRILHRYSRSA
jgi:hypothetical protein